MTIRSRIITTFIVIFTMTILSMVSQKIMINKGEALNDGLDHINLELVALLALENTVNRESRKILETLGNTKDQDEDIVLLSDKLIRSFTNVWEVNKEYHVPNLFEGFEKAELEEKGLEKLLKEKQRQLQQGQKRIEEYLAQGDRARALQFKRDFYRIELGPEFMSIIDGWVSQERKELSESQEEHDKYVVFHITMMNSIGFVFLMVLLWLSYSLNRTIGHRLEKLVDHTRLLAKGNFRQKAEIEGSDELARLAVSFNEMTSELSRTQDKLLEQSYQSGMSEVAADILHNVKNSFSGISSGCEKVNTLIRGSRVVKVRNAVKELIQVENPVSDEKRANLYEYINLATLDLEEQFERIREANNQIERTFFLIDSILTDQYRYTKVDHPLQWCNLYDILKDTLMLLSDKTKSEVGIDIDSGIEKIGEIYTHRIVFIQVITNIVTNAIESIARQSAENGLVNIRAFIQNDPSGENVHLIFKDNGVGIGPDNFETLFQRGRSSKSDMAHTGLGLHWVANAVQALDGRIYAESDGVGKGAAFHLIIRREGRYNQAG